MNTTADEILVRREQVRKSSWNAKDRTLEVVVSTFADVKRYSFVERLSRDPADWNLARVASPGGVPFLDSHNAYAADARLGRVMSVTIGKSDVRAVVKLNEGEAANAFVREIEGGTPPGISIGYSVGRWQLAEAPDDGPDVRLAREISILEVSAVSVAADPGAHVRAQESTMPKPRNYLTPPARDPIDEPTDNIINDNLADQARADERRRVSDMHTVARRFDMPADFIARHVRAATSEADFRLAILDSMAAEQEEVDIRSYPPGHRGDYHHSLDNPSAFRAAAVTAFVDRIHNRTSEGLASAVLADGEVAFARRVLQNSGQNCLGWSDQRVLRSYATTSDFALIAGGVANVRIGETYTAAASPITAVFGKKLLPDFNIHTSALVDWSTLKIEKVGEHGEYISSYVDESGERIKLYTLGGITGLTRQLLINAHGALDDMSTAQGRRLAADCAERMVRFLEVNDYASEKMRDNIAVFHASRSNIETLPTYNQQTTAQELMRLRGKAARRKSAGNVIIGVAPSIWLVHPDFEGYALQTLASVNAAELANVNPAAGRFTVVSEPGLADPSKSWILADPLKMHGAVRLGLEGQESPDTQSREGFTIDGVEFRIRLDFGLGWLEWRSWTRLDHDSTPPDPEPEE